MKEKYSEKPYHLYLCGLSCTCFFIVCQKSDYKEE